MAQNILITIALYAMLFTTLFEGINSQNDLLKRSSFYYRAQCKKRKNKTSYNPKNYYCIADLEKNARGPIWKLTISIYNEKRAVSEGEVILFTFEEKDLQKDIKREVKGTFRKGYISWTTHSGYTNKNYDISWEYNKEKNQNVLNLFNLIIIKKLDDGTIYEISEAELLFITKTTILYNLLFILLMVPQYLESIICIFKLVNKKSFILDLPKLFLVNDWCLDITLSFFTLLFFPNYFSIFLGYLFFLAASMLPVWPFLEPDYFKNIHNCKYVLMFLMLLFVPVVFVTLLILVQVQYLLSLMVVQLAFFVLDGLVFNRKEMVYRFLLSLYLPKFLTIWLMLYVKNNPQRLPVNYGSLSWILPCIGLLLFIVLVQKLYHPRFGWNTKHEIEVEQRIPKTMLLEKLLCNYGESHVKNEVCSICLEPFFNDSSRDSEVQLQYLGKSKEMVNITSCNHIFHIYCLEVWRRENASCPICRTRITEE